MTACNKPETLKQVFTVWFWTICMESLIFTVKSQAGFDVFPIMFILFLFAVVATVGAMY